MRIGWRFVAIGEAFRTVTGRTPKKSVNEFYGDFMPFVKPPELLDRYLTSSNDGLSELGSREARVLPPGAVLVSCIGNLGKVGVSTVELACNQQINAILPDSAQALPDYIFHFCTSDLFRDQLKALASGTTIPIVNKSKFNSINIPLPPLPEQKRIVEILDAAFAAIDKATANTEKNIKNAEELFEDFVTHSLWKHQASSQVGILADVCSKFEYGSSAKSHSTGHTPVLRMGNIQDGQLDWKSLKYSSDADEITKYSLHPNEVLFNRTNSAEHVGKCAIYRGAKPAIFAGYLIRIHHNPEKLSPEYLNFYLNSRAARAYGKTVMTQSVNQANINASKLKNYPIPLPNLEDQKSLAKTFVKVKTATKELISTYSHKLGMLNNLKQSILHKAFSGEL